MRGLLALLLAGLSWLLAKLSRLTMFPAAALADGAEWCDRQARNLSEPML